MESRAFRNSGKASTRCLALWGCLALAGCFSTDAPEAPLPLAGGAMTIHSETSAAFSSPSPNLEGAALRRHMDGDAAFEATFVTAPAPVNGGLGPVFNNTSCAACHAGDGRGRPPASGETIASMLIRLSLPGVDGNGAPLSVPGFGSQLQQRAVFGKQPEAQVDIAYRDSVVRMADGEEISLRIPDYRIRDAYAPLGNDVLISPRVAPPVFGLGLLEAVDEAAILALADESDRDGNGISGKANYVHDALTGKQALGRFGWKANTPNLIQQNAAAYNNDMGITSPVFPEETCQGQIQGCESGEPEVDEATLAEVTFYVQTLAVPAQRNADDPEVHGGERVFKTLRCDACHVPDLATGSRSDLPEVSGQRIRPFTDLLVHDMGAGLDDGRPDFLATGREWRTAPLWGIGLTGIVNGHTQFLHDGRARNLAEAVLWHGGEAEKPREDFRKLEKADRERLLRFLESL